MSNDTKVGINRNERTNDHRLNLDAIKKAFEYTEINCTTDSTTASEQLKKFVENLCQTMQNELQTEKQIEMEGFIKEWNNQRKWLLNQVTDSHSTWWELMVFYS